MGRYRKAALLNIPKKKEVVAALKKVADEKLSHLFQLDEQTINNVLTLLGYYCEHHGTKATPEFYKDILLAMVQWEDGACGHRFELWAM